MSLLGFRSANHPQQVGRHGAEHGIDDRATAPELFDPLHARFHFTIDVAAAAHNAKCERYYDRETDGLAQDWTGERVWCNPPYSAIAPWVIKAWESHPAAPLIVLLLPANRTEQAWWQDLIEPYRDRPGSPLSTEFLRGRYRFLRKGQLVIRPNERPPFGCCLLIWGATREPAPPFAPRLTLFTEGARDG